MMQHGKPREHMHVIQYERQVCCGHTVTWMLCEIKKTIQ